MMDRVGQLLAGAEVEWRTLGEVADISRGVRVVRRQLESTGLYPVYQNALAPLGYLDRHNCPAGTVFVIAAGAAGQIGYSEVDFWAADDCFRFHCHEGLIGRFLYYWLLDRQVYLKLRVRRAAVPRLPRLALEEFLIPIPPLPVQAEIVRILDTFTKLEAELEGRMKQYAYYRDRLLSFEGEEVEWKTLGEVGTFYGGLSGKTRKDFAHGSAAYIPYRNIFGNPELDPCWLETVDVADSERQHAVQYGDVLFTASSETANEVGMSSVVTTHFARPVYLNSFSFGFRFHAGVKILPAFSKHLFRGQALRRVIVKTANGTIRYNVSRARFSNIMIPLPSLAMQTEIAEVLDRLHALSHSLMDGLPAELRARRKQYEHYRERLLTFSGGPDRRG